MQDFPLSSWRCYVIFRNIFLFFQLTLFPLNFFVTCFWDFLVCTFSLITSDLGVKQDSDEVLKLSEEDGRQIFIFLESIYIIMNRILLEIWMLKVFLVRSQMKIITHCWKLDEVDFDTCFKWQKMEELYSTVGWKVNL